MAHRKLNPSSKLKGPMVCIGPVLFLLFTGCAHHRVNPFVGWDSVERYYRKHPSKHDSKPSMPCLVLPPIGPDEVPDMPDEIFIDGLPAGFVE
jgi:hypothetical protein